MRPTRSPRVKVCCIGSVPEARAAVDAGAAAIGLVTTMPSGPGVISDELAAKIAAEVPPGVDSFLLTSRCDAQSILEQHARIRTTTLQLVDRVDAAELKLIRGQLAGVRLVQVVHVSGPEAVAEALAVAPHVDAVLLDSGNPLAAVKELGGTGRPHNWLISREIRERLDAPVFLAGGLNPTNVREAIDTVRPYGLDVCSGLRVESELDRPLLRAFFVEVARASIE